MRWRPTNGSPWWLTTTCPPAELGTAPQEELKLHHLYATGTTGTLLGKQAQPPITCLFSRSHGRRPAARRPDRRGQDRRDDLLLGSLNPAAHDPDVKALLRLAAVWNIPVATNEATADFIMDSPHMQQAFSVQVPGLRRVSQGQNRVADPDGKEPDMVRLFMGEGRSALEALLGERAWRS